MDNKELIWVTKEQAEAFKDLGSDQCKKNFVDRLIRDRKIDIQCSIESLDDDLLRLKAFALTYKTELQKVYDEQSDMLDKIWVSSQDKITEIENKIKKIKPELDKTMKIIGDLNKSLSNVSTYQVDRLIETVNRVNSMSAMDKELLMDLINLTKTKE